MSYSLYISCKSIEQRDELWNEFRSKFEFPSPEDETYMGTDLSYVHEEMRPLHFGVELRTTGYMTNLVVICLAKMAKKNDLKLYWDFDDLKIENMTTENLSSMENFIRRNVKNSAKLRKTNAWSHIRSSILLAIGFYLEERSIRKNILKTCNRIITKFN